MPADLTVRTASQLLDRGFSLADAVTRATDRAVLDAEVEAQAPLAGRELLVAWKDLARDVAWDLSPELLGGIIAAQDPLALAGAMIGAKYAALGGAGGLLGSTSTAVTGCPDGVGFYRHYQQGSIYWHPQTGAHEVHGALRAHWASLGWERSFLGYPTSDELVGRDPAAVGRVSHFAGGSLYWTPAPAPPPLQGAALATALAGGTLSAVVRTEIAAGSIRIGAVGRSRSELAAGRGRALTEAVTGGVLAGAEVVVPPPRRVFEVHGAIRSRYLALGGEGSFLGYPTTDETTTPDGIGRYNHFQAGSIYWTPSTSAHEVHGLIRALWAAGGWERDPSLGYPLTDELVPDRRVGHRRPETTRKPVRGLPADVVKLPASAAAGGFARTIVNGVKAVNGTALGRLLDAGTLTPAALASVGPGHGQTGGRTTAAAERSPHRFGDFEDGVVFWERGAPTATKLPPWRPDGGSGPTIPAATVVTAAKGLLDTALEGRVASAVLAGVTGYHWDGVGTHLRRHRLLVRLRTEGGGGGGLFGSVFDSITEVVLEVHAQVGFDPVQRTVTLGLVHWQGTSPGAAFAARWLHARLDPRLWQTTSLRDLTQARGDRPVAVLSVKVERDGGVAVYLEPQRVVDLTDHIGVLTGGMFGGAAVTEGLVTDGVRDLIGVQPAPRRGTGRNGRTGRPVR